VPFGEFIPLQHWISFLSPLVGGLATFAAGESVTMLPVAGHQVSTAICYEVIFPRLAREAVDRGSELLTTITNDAWYGTTSAPYQHFALASMRAIEQGRYLVRAPTPASAAPWTHMGGWWRSRLSLNRRAWWWTCASCRGAPSMHESATWRRTRRWR
jgi:apolipoprotein N-acyltransferase